MNSIKSNRIILLLVVLFISALFFAMIRYFLMAIFLAAIFSALAMPMHGRFLLWTRGRKGLSAGLTMLVLFLIGFLPLALLLTVVALQAVQISSQAVPWLQQLLEPAFLADRFRSFPYYTELVAYREEVLQRVGEIASKTGSVLFKTLFSFTYSAVNELFLFTIFLYTMFFFLRDGKPLLEQILYYLPLSDADQHRLLDKFLSVTRATIKGTMIVGMVQGGLAGLALHLGGIESALFWGTLMTVLSIVPVLGPPLIWVPAVISLVAAGRYPQAVAVALFCAVVVGQIDNILRPILVGRDTRLHELFIFFGTLGGIGLFGLFGFIIGPIIAALFMTVWEMYGEAFSDSLRDIKQRSAVPEPPE